MVGRKMEDWRILTPIFSAASPILVAALAWFMVRTVNQYDEQNKRLMEKMDIFIETRQKADIDVERRLTMLQYRCCKENN